MTSIDFGAVAIRFKLWFEKDEVEDETWPFLI
jgi:hypothetical protein